MPHLLKPHPSTPSPAVERIEVEVARSRPRGLALRYVLTGDIAAIRIPPHAPPRRADDLWKTTCFEAFVRADEGAAYYELNLSPSREWAAYAFDAYRQGGRDLEALRVPGVVSRWSDHDLVLEAALSLGSTDLPIDDAWRLGLSAVIESQDGSISYWALAHPPGRPDFHHGDCFALELQAPQRV